jgi:hypothetical protein
LQYGTPDNKGKACQSIYPGNSAELASSVIQGVRFESKACSDKFYLSGISKSFELCLEYLWKGLKQEIEEEGLEAYTPKEYLALIGKFATRVKAFL